MARRLLLLGLAACGRLDFALAHDANAGAGPNVDGATDASVPGLIHRYRFNGDLTDDFGGPPLAALVVGAFTASGYQFAIDGGLTLPIGTGFPPSAYTVDMVFAFDTVTGWSKILDYDGGTLDRGLYVYEAALQQVIVPNGMPTPDFETSTAAFAPAVMTRVTITRDASNLVVGYIGGAAVAAGRAPTETVPTTSASFFTFDDPAGTARLNASAARWFVDDSATAGGEASSGTVREITIWNLALSAAQVATI